MDILTSEHLVAKGTFDAVSLLNSSTNPIFQQYSTIMSIIVYKNDYEDFDETIADMSFQYWMVDGDDNKSFLYITRDNERIVFNITVRYNLVTMRYQWDLEVYASQPDTIQTFLENVILILKISQT